MQIDTYATILLKSNQFFCELALSVVSKDANAEHRDMKLRPLPRRSNEVGLLPISAAMHQQS